MTSRIAILFEGDTDRIRGEFTAIHNRVKVMKTYPNISVDVFVFDFHFGDVLTKIKGKKIRERKCTFTFDGVSYCCIWYKRSLLDFLCRRFLKMSTSIEERRVAEKRDYFSTYNLLYANSLKTGLLALELKKHKNIPFVVAWHGSSIHTNPFKYTHIYKSTKRVLEAANHNFFVSDELYHIAKDITINFVGSVSYNGVDTKLFREYSPEEKGNLYVILGINRFEKNVAFVGNDLPVKNIEFLPRLFGEIKKQIPKCAFYVIGKGNFGKLFENTHITITNLEVPNTKMPLWYNCMNLVVMPSFHEGLPMTCLEATACGVPFIGSRVGAISDVVGVENTIPHGKDFEKMFIDKCIKTLNNYTEIVLPESFRLSLIVEKEISIIEQIILNSKLEYNA